MSRINPHLRDLPSALWDEMQSVLEDFESVWRRGERPDLNAYLRPGPALYFPLLVELVHVDLELRLKAGDGARVEEYLRRYPGLSRERQTLLALIRAEFHLRQRQEPELRVDEYLRRFPEHATELSAWISQQPTEVWRPTSSPRDDVNATLTTGTASVSDHPSPCPAIPGYEILGELGRGGMGVVYKARHVKLKRMVALKMIRAGQLAGEQERGRFLLEAEAVARLRHPNIVQIFEIGEWEGRPYFSLEFVEGGSLDRKLARAPQPPREAAQKVEILARAMQHAHEQQVLHRDLKPANVLLETDGTLKITDFGLARQLDDDDSQTHSGTIMGTPSYMPPEQAAGKAKELGPAADIYALGAVLYEMLTGQPPFKGASAYETLDLVCNTEPVPPQQMQPKLPPDLETICLKCLHKEPGQRYASAAALADDLHRFLADEPIHARAARLTERAWRWCRRNPAPALAASLAVLLLIVVTVGSFVLAWTESANASRLAGANTKITQEQGRTKDALKTAERNEREAILQRQRAERQSVELLFDKGVALCERGEMSQGLLWLARALEVAERSEAATDLQRSIRANLAAWSRENRPLRQAFTHDAGHLAIVRGKVAGADRAQPNSRPIDHAFSSLAFSPNGRLVTTCSVKAVRLHDVMTGKPVGPPLKHGDLINSVSFSPDGKTLLTGSNDGMARCWDVASGQLLGKPLALGQAVRLVAYTPDGRIFVTVLRTSAQLWDAATIRPVGVPLECDGPIQAAAFSPDSTMLLTGTRNGYARLWQPGTGRPLTPPLQHQDEELELVAFNPTGKAFVTAWRNARLWEAPSGKSITGPLELSKAMWSLAFSPDGQTLLTTDLGGNARLWDGITGKPRGGQLPKQGDLLSAGFSPDGKQFFLAGGAGTVQFRSTATGEPVGPPIQHPATVAHTVFSPDGRTILTFDANGVVRLWEAMPSPPNATFVRPPDGNNILAFGPDGRSIAVAGANNTVTVRPTALDQPPRSVLRHAGPVLAAAFHPDGKVLLTGSADKTARLWEVVTGRQQGPALEHADAVTAVAWVPGGGQLLTTTRSGISRLWEGATGKPLAAPVAFTTPDPFGCTPLNRNDVDLVSAITVRESQLLCATIPQAVGQRNTVRVSFGTTHTRIDALFGVDALAFSPNSRMLVTGGSDAMIRLWDPLSGNPLASPFHNQAALWGAAFSPDGRRLLIRGIDHSFRLWDPATRKMIGPVLTDVETATFSPDSKVVLVGGRDQTIRAWDSVLGKPIGPALRHPGPIHRLALSGDDELLRTVGGDGTTRMWDLTPLPLVGKAERIALWVQVATGLELDDEGVVQGLEPSEWQRRRDRLTQLGGKPVSSRVP
jgi:WD40 repeat protein/tRNA A-37 threonylcarbamoyl transferase component Bud32